MLKILSITVFAFVVWLGLQPDTIVVTVPVAHASAPEPVLFPVAEEKLKPVVPEVPKVLALIAECESEGQQFEEDGTTVKRGVVNPKDVGKYQINEFYHLDDAKRLGYDIYTEAGNTEMALHLYKQSGTMPWLASKDCWASRS